MTAAETTSTLDPSEPTAEAAAPAVVVVVVTCNPGWWLEDCIASLAAQDYPELSVLVVDADSAEDPTPRVGAIMPGAYVRRVRRRRGFAAAANEAIGAVEGASHFVFCHDDVVLAPDAVRSLVAEAFRSNAGVVAPKLVGWFAPDRLVATGMGADRFGVPVALVERGELDQQQHDAVREVFFAPSACVLVRADLFATLGGFDAAYGTVGEDLDLSWRVHLAGARVVFAPGARVRHLEATEGGQRALEGSLRATGPDAEARAEALGMTSAVFVEDVDAALNPTGLIPTGLTPTGPAPSGPGAPGGVAPDLDRRDVERPPHDVAGSDSSPVPPGPPAAEETAWDLTRWDEEEAAEVADAAAAAARHAGHHASWRARRDAERTTAADTWTGDDDDWDDSWSSRRRSRKVAAARVRQAGRAAAAARSGWGGFRAEGRLVVARDRGPDADELDDRRAEARLRAVATNYAGSSLVTRLPLLFLLTAVEATVRLIRRGPQDARRTLRPWPALVRQSGAIRARRHAVRKTRAVPDRQITALQVSGTARIRQALRTAAVPGFDAARTGPGTGRRWPILVWIGALLVMAGGSRAILAGHLPTIGEFAPWPSVGTMGRHFGSGWRATGLGSAGPAPTLLGLLAVAGTVLLGHTTLLQHVLVVGMIPLGALGAARLGRALGSPRASLVALVAYLAVPLPYNAMANGRWSGLVAYGATPWVLALLLRATATDPFVARLDSGGDVGRRPQLKFPARIVSIGLVTALVGAVAPSYLVVVLVCGVALFAGVLLGARRLIGVRAAVAALAGCAVAAILLAPWSTGWKSWATFTGVAPATAYALHLGTLMRFQTGSVGSGAIGYALLVAAALPLTIGRGWRASWAIALWTVVLSSWGLAWAGQHNALGAVWPTADVALAPAAAAIATLVALGIASFDLDLPGFTFGWRQIVSGGAALALGVACLPVLAAAGDGRWRQPAAGYDTILSWMQQKRTEGDFRVLWIGAPDALPVAGWPLDGTVAYATTRNGPPQLVDGRPGGDGGPTHLLRDFVTLARRGQTTDLGHLLAPMGVRYIAMVEHANPLQRGPSHARPVPADLHGGLESQLDMRRVDRSDALTVYENEAWAPTRIRLPDGATAAAQSGDPRAARTVSLQGAPPVLPSAREPASFRGPIAAGSAIEVAEAPSSHWTLTVAGRRAAHQTGFGSVNLFTSDAGGAGALRYGTPLGWRLAEAGEAILWIVAVVVAARGRRRPRPAVAAAVDR